MHHRFRTASLATAIALAMASTAAFAAPPTADQLPGQGKIVTDKTTVDASQAPTAGEQTIGINGKAVIDWGSGTDINKTGPAGFNIGSGAKLHFNGTSGADAVLNIDSSGNASQIMGRLDDTGSGSGASIYVANKNGVIVGAHATISSGGTVGLIGNVVDKTSFDGTAGALAINGAGGGDVTVNQGASISGGTIFISGGNNVNVNLGALHGPTSLFAGVARNASGGPFGGDLDNSHAMLAVDGTLPAGGSVHDFHSAGDASNAGTLDLTGVMANTGAELAVPGTFTNTGDLTLNGDDLLTHMVNNGKLTTENTATFDALTNTGVYVSAGSGININGGDLVNSGSMTLAAGGLFEIYGGDFINTGMVAGAGYIAAHNGSVDNSGTLAGVTTIRTESDEGSSRFPADTGFTPGADYSITNSGVISGALNGGGYTGAGSIYANVDGDAAPGYFRSADATNTTTGSFHNTGTLKFSGGTDFIAYVHDDLTLGGKVMVEAGSGFAPVSADHPLQVVRLGTESGTLTVSSPLAFSDNAQFYGAKASNMMADVTGTKTSRFLAVAGSDAPTSGYAIRVARGATLYAPEVFITGYEPTDHPNVILQGTVSGDKLFFGVSGQDSSGNKIVHPVSDVFTGPEGGLVVTGGDRDYVEFDFTGAIKTAPYTNADNFRYNDLPISAKSPVTLLLNPVAYRTNGTSNGKSAVNILVNNDVTLLDTVTASAAEAPTSAQAVVSGINATQNTHLVLQSTGSITAGNSADGFFWPGYVYLGTIASDSDGNAMPGTYSALNTITTVGDFNNTLAGRVQKAGGIHFATSGKVNFGGDVYTNANSWVNFGNTAVTKFYAAGNAGVNFYHGDIGANGNIVTYGQDLPTNYFHTQPANSKK